MFARAGSHEVATTRKAAALGKRLDGRKMDEYPAIECTLGGIAQTSGSAELRLGSAHVFVGIKVEVEAPSRERPDEGRVALGVQISPCAAPGSDARALDHSGEVLAARLQRLMFGRQAGQAGIDLRSLAIIPGRSAWVIYVDCIVLSAGGSLLDALSCGVSAAISDLRLPRVRVPDGLEDPQAADIEVDDDPHACVLLDASLLPVVVGVCQIGKQLVMGATAVEEQSAQGRLVVSVNSKGQVCGMQKLGQSVLDFGMLQHMSTAAQQQGKSVLQALKTHFSSGGMS